MVDDLWLLISDQAIEANSRDCKHTNYNNGTQHMYTPPMNELLPPLALVGASLGIATVLGALVWCWMKLSLRYRKQYRRF